MRKNFRLLYGFLMVVVVSLMTVGATYAYWTASTSSANNAVQTESTTYSISMSINSLYDGFSVIPMNDEDAVKALSKKCKDKYDRGACSAYTIEVYDYSENLDYISGYMDLTTNNMQNLSYMMFRLSDTYEEGKCVTIGADSEGSGDTGTDTIDTNDTTNKLADKKEEHYCVVKEATPMGDGIGLSLGDKYDVTGMDSTSFILLVWLSNLDTSQNNIDIGSFNAVVTMQAGNGGKIRGSISSVVVVDDLVGDGE